MSARVPLYQRRVENTKPEPSTQITPSPSFTKVETPSITTEQLLDQLRQDALLPKYPSNEDFCYPDNVPIANQPSEKAMITDHSPNTQINAIENSSNNDTSFADSLIDSIESDDTEEPDKPQVPIISSASQSTNVTTNTISPPPSVTYVPSHTTLSYVPNFVPRNTATITNPYPGKSNIFTPSRPSNYVTKQENLNNPTTTSTTSHKQVDDQFRNESYSQPQQKTDTNTIEKYQMKSLGNKYDQSMQNHRAFEQPPFSTPVAKNTTHSDQFSHQSHQNYFSYVNHNPVHNSNSNVIKIHSDTVKPYLSDLLLEDRNNISEKQFEKQSYSDDDNDNDEPVFDQELDTQEDEFFKTIEASLASVTFNSVNNNKEKPTQDEMNKRPKNKPHGETESDSHIESHIIPTDSEKISTAVKDGTSIPVRVHSGNVRRGRIIVSANEKKRRTVSHFSPHPPPISKNESKVDFKSTSAPKKTNKETTQSKKHPSSPSTNAKKTPTKRNSFSSGHHMRQVYSPPTTTTLNKYSPRSKTTPSKDTNKPYRGTSPKSKPVQKQSSFTITKRDHNNNFLINNNNNNIAYYNDHVKQKQPSPQTPRKNSDYLSKQNRIALDKTPTDEEINKLWANVRNCLSTEAPEQAYSDTAFIAPKRVHHQRTFSGSLVRRVSNDSSLYQGGGNHHQATSNRRYGSHEALNRPNSNSSSSSSASSFSNRHALLPQRSNRILSPKLVIDRNSNLSNNSNTYFTRKKDHALSSHHKKDKEVTESMATFLALEELCNEQSLTPRQTEAVFKVSKSLIKKQMHAEESTKGLSALSIEERKVMDSLDRINDKLKRQDELQRTLSAKGR
ncbi:probable WRKY transcription factor protein 1 [Clytia hemisphaerica]|uniref:Uncharacterized protein n=1 Tax=Clytia hemisphaerica TaxID=252671 RepID=A0A7M5WRP8_9CNID